MSGELAPEVFRYYLLQDRYYLEHFSKLYFLIAKKSASEEIQAHLRKISTTIFLRPKPFPKNQPPFYY